MRLERIRLPGAEVGAVNPRAIVIGGGAAVVIAFAVWLFYPRSEMGSLPEPGIVAPDEEPVATEEERAVSAREAIAELQESSSPDYDAAVERGREFAADGRYADAQLMYFFAARGGQAEAAYELGRMYDPVSFSSETSNMDEPDPFQAYKWYTQAAEGGVAEAGSRLEDLRGWTEREAEGGNVEAEQLLLQWD